MEIGLILKNKQPETYKKLNTSQKKKHKKRKGKKEKLTEKDIKYLMCNRSYKRGPGGAIRQTR